MTNSSVQQDFIAWFKTFRSDFDVCFDEDGSVRINKWSKRDGYHEAVTTLQAAWAGYRAAKGHQ